MDLLLSKQTPFFIPRIPTLILFRHRCIYVVSPLVAFFWLPLDVSSFFFGSRRSLCKLEHRRW